MATRVIYHPNGFTEITGCPHCADAPVLCFYAGAWRIDYDDGLEGLPVRYCPWCGTELTPPEVAENQVTPKEET